MDHDRITPVGQPRSVSRRKWVVFYSSVQPEGDLYVARTDGTGLRQLTSGAEPIDRMPRWSPDGQWIAFHSIRGKDQYLWKIRPDGSELQQLSPLADAIYPAWSPDGSGSLCSWPRDWPFRE